MGKKRQSIEPRCSIPLDMVYAVEMIFFDHYPQGDRPRQYHIIIHVGKETNL